jgi:hypothetical protein
MAAGILFMLLMPILILSRNKDQFVDWVLARNHHSDINQISTILDQGVVVVRSCNDDPPPSKIWSRIFGNKRVQLGTSE